MDALLASEERPAVRVCEASGRFVVVGRTVLTRLSQTFHGAISDNAAASKNDAAMGVRG
jgi:hypothetical protein